MLVVVISHGVWQRRFGGETSVLGKSITLDDVPHEIVGVMPAEFTAVSQFGLVDPISFWAARYYPTDLLANHADHEINVVARLAPGTTLEAAERSLAAISDDLARRFPQTNEHLRAHVRLLGDDLVRRVQTSLVVIMSMVGFILLIACVNVANLLIVRGAGKRREVAIRYALGATRVRVASEMLVESLVLAAGAGVLGVGLAAGVKNVLVSLAPQNLPRLYAVGLDGRVIGFSAGIALASGVMFGVLPAWQARTARPIEALGSGERTVASRWMARWRNALLIAEIAISMILLIGAGLMVKSLVSLNAVDLGFRTDHVLAMNVNLPERRYKTADDRYRFFQALEAQLSAVPGVMHVGFANRFPLRGGWVSSVEIDGAKAPNASGFDANCQPVNPGYFDTLDLHLLRGRLLEAGDGKTAEPVAVVSEAFSTQLLHNADAIGHRIRLRPTAPWVTVVGVIADIRRGGKTADIHPQVYLSAAQTDLYPAHLADVAVQVDERIADTVAMRTALSRTVWAVDRDQSVSNVRTLDEVVATGAQSQRFQATLVTLFAALALTLAIVGIHGVVSYAVTQRTPEIGIRMALGADRWAILRWLLRGTATLVLIGAAAGLAGAVLLSKYVSSLLFQLTATDPPTYVSAALLISTVAIGSAALAARRATTIDPVQALRTE